MQTISDGGGGHAYLQAGAMHQVACELEEHGRAVSAHASPAAGGELGLAGPLLQAVVADFQEAARSLAQGATDLAGATRTAVAASTSVDAADGAAIAAAGGHGG